MASFFISLT